MKAQPKIVVEAAHRVSPPRSRLLAAAEGILLEHGFQSLTTRAICKAADTNISQISYYFGGLEGLLDALLSEELAAVSKAFGAADLAAGGNDISSLMRLLMAALRTPAPHTPDGFAALAIEEIYQHVSGDMRRRAGETLDAAHAPLRAALAARLSTMDDLTIRFRLAAVIAMAMSMLPRRTGWRLFVLSTEGRQVSDDHLFEQMLPLCVATWQ
jgi:AcrR family transcriptional regulator